MIRTRTAGRESGSIRTLFTLGATGDLDDGLLLERFTEGEGEAADSAFAALVERHGALVWRACLAVLRDEHEAEDAFQAAFIVLALKARSLRVRGSLGPWLHRVAYRTASGLRTSAARRRKHERRRAERDGPRPAEAAASGDPDRDAAIHEELARLSEKYRGPLVLCDLEGRTHPEAAKALGWPVGTVKSRQSRGRRLLRGRLERRGVGLTAAALSVSPPRRAVAEAAVRHSIRLATGIGTSSHVLLLTRGVLRAMLWTKLRSLTTAAVAVGLAVGGTSAYVRGYQDAAPGDAPPAVVRRAAPRKDPEVYRRALEVQRLAARKAGAVYEIARQNRLLAEIALDEYELVAYPRDLASAEDRIKAAESEASRTGDRREWAARMLKAGYVSRGRAEEEERAAERARLALEEAAMHRKALEHHDRAKVVDGLRLDIEKARAEEKAEENAWDRERAREADLERRAREAG